MKNKKAICILVVFISLLALVAAATGIFSKGGPGQFEFTSIHGESVLIHGEGLYKNMSAATVQDGISQDFITIVLAIPLLIISLILAIKGSLKGRLLLTGSLLYFLFTYLLYSVLTMYNEMFLAYVVLTSLSFFAFILVIMSFELANLRSYFNDNIPVKFIGGFLIFIPVVVALMWIGRIVPALLNGTLPAGLEHYTTLPVQALDLAFMHPAAVISGILLIKRKPLGYLLAPVLTTFLTIMMSAIAAKVAGQMLFNEVDGLPILIGFILFAITALICTALLLRGITLNRKERF